jgi:FAD/FMN-containing dehydrogenase
MSSNRLGGLASIVGDHHVLADPELRAPYEVDWTGRFRGKCAAVVRPGDSGEASRVLAWCNERSIAVVPQGGNTGLVGGSVPRAVAGDQERDTVVLSLRRLDSMERVDSDSLLLVAGAGTTLATAQEQASRVGCELGIDLAARGSATLGGMVATNAGGMHVLRHGSMRARTVGLEVVLADGTLVRRLDGLWKDNVGLDLVSLFSATEGTLGVVTAVAMRLLRLPRERVTGLIALGAPSGSDDLGSATAAAVAAAREIQGTVDGVEAIEVTFPPGTELVVDRFGLVPPPGWGEACAWLTVEAAGSSDPTSQLAAALENVGAVLDAAVASDGDGRARLWRYREAHPDAIASLGVPHKLDVSVPVGCLSAFAEGLPIAIESAAPGSQFFCFGHIADGNMHVNVVGPSPEDDAVDEAVLRLALDNGGSISAEHGIGVAKARYLTLARTPSELDLAARIKAALDPRDVLNPGVLAVPLA